jgi:hypothetical protein
MSLSGSSCLRSFRLPIDPYNKCRSRLSKEVFASKTISEPWLKTEDLHDFHLESQADVTLRGRIPLLDPGFSPDCGLLTFTSSHWTPIYPCSQLPAVS